MHILLLIAALLLFGAGPGARPDAAPRLKERAQLTLRAAPDAVALPAADAPPDITFTARVLDPNGEAAGVRIGYRVFIRSAAEALFERLEHEAAAIPPRDMAPSGGGATDQGQVTFYQDVLRPADLPPEAVIVDVVAEAHAYDAAGEPLEGVATTLRVPFFDTDRQPVLRLISPAPGDALVEGWQRFIVTLERNRTNTAYYQLAFCSRASDLLEWILPGDCLGFDASGRGRHEMLVALPHSAYWWGVRAFDHDGRLVAVSTAWPVQVVIAGASGRPPTLPTPSPEPDRLISLISLSFPWRLAPNQTVFYLPVDEPGEIVVSTAWQGTQRELVITLDAPGRPAPVARQEGPSPLQLHYLATEEDVEGAYRWWRVTISSPGDGIAAAGALAMMYPGSRLSGMFNVAPDVGAVVIVLPVAGPGRVSATAAWEGAPASLVMQLDGPRLARPYTHTEGAAPLRLSFDIEPFDHVTGESWTLSLIAFARPDADGSLTAVYPGER